MFENVIGQKNIIRQLTQDINGNSLPSSVLLYGEGYTGKQTAALEIARILLCEEGTADWKCSCPSCGLNRLLIHPGVVLTGPRNFIDEIEACADVYLRQERRAGAFLFIRALEKCIRRFDPHVFETSDAKEKKIRDCIEVLQEGIYNFNPDRKKPEPKALKKLVDGCVDKAKTLAKEFPQDNIPISTVRNITAWVHTTGMSSKKVVILENCEKMMDGSRNALLKILEEPPEAVYFICITRRKGLLIPTIQSRLRGYHFPPRTEDEENKVLESIFGEKTGEYPNLESFFLAWRNIKTDDLHANASQFLTYTESRESDYLSVIQEITDSLKDKENAFYFLRALTRLLGERYRKLQILTPEDIAEHEEWNKNIQDCLTGINLYNQRPSLKIEDLFLTMRQKQ